MNKKIGCWFNQSVIVIWKNLFQHSVMIFFFWLNASLNMSLEEKVWCCDWPNTWQCFSYIVMLTLTVYFIINLGNVFKLTYLCSCISFTHFVLLYFFNASFTSDIGVQYQLHFTKRCLLLFERSLCLKHCKYMYFSWKASGTNW